MSLYLQGYVSASMGVPGRTPGTMFAPIPVESISYSPEIVGSECFLKILFILLTI